MILIGLGNRHEIGYKRESYPHYFEFSALLSGDAPRDWSSDGAQDEPAPIQPAQHAARSSTTQQIIASKHSRVSLDV